MYRHVIKVHGRKRRSAFNLDAQSKLSGYNNRGKVNEKHTFPYLDAITNFTK